MAFLTSSGFTIPKSSTGKYVTSKPFFSKYSQVCNTAWCSVFCVIMWPLPFLNATPFIAKFILSVPLPVKIISLGSALSCFAIFALASIIASCASSPRP